MTQAIKAYREITVSPEFREIERLRDDARHNEASALLHAERKGERKGASEERAKWQILVAHKDTALADKDAEIARLRALLGES